MTEREMFEKSFQRPRSFYHLDIKDQLEIDRQLGISHWEGKNLSEEDKKRYREYYNVPPPEIVAVAAIGIHNI